MSGWIALLLKRGFALRPRVSCGDIIVVGGPRSFQPEASAKSDEALKFVTAWVLVAFVWASQLVAYSDKTLGLQIYHPNR